MVDREKGGAERQRTEAGRVLAPGQTRRERKVLAVCGRGPWAWGWGAAECLMLTPHRAPTGTPISNMQQLCYQGAPLTPQPPPRVSGLTPVPHTAAGLESWASLNPQEPAWEGLPALSTTLGPKPRQGTPPLIHTSGLAQGVGGDLSVLHVPRRKRSQPRKPPALAHDSKQTGRAPPQCWAQPLSPTGSRAGLRGQRGQRWPPGTGRLRAAASSSQPRHSEPQELAAAQPSPHMHARKVGSPAGPESPKGSQI